MGKPTYAELERRVEELERILAETAARRDFQFATRDLIYFRGYRDWSVEFFDRKIEELTGWPLEDFLDRKVKWLHIVQPEYREQAQDAVKRALKSDKYYEARYPIVTRSGQTRWVAIRGYIVCDDQGDFLAVQGVLNDITREKQTERALESETELFTRVANVLEDGIYIVREDYRILFMNEALIELVGDHVGEVCHQALFGRQTPCPWTVMSTIQEEQCGVQEYHLPGVERIFQVRSFPIRMRDGTIGKVGRMKEVTHTRRLQNEVKEFAVRQQALEDAANKAELGICLLQDHLGVEARFRFVNEAFCNITGYSPEELLNMGFAELFQGKMRHEALERYRRRQAGETLNQVYEFELRRKDGSVVPVIYSAALSLCEGRMATIGFMRDITERRTVQQMLLQSQRLASIGRLAAEIAHEINNPLTSALTFSKLIRKIMEQEPFPSERLAELRQYISHLDAETSRCADIAKGLLDFARQGRIEIRENDLGVILKKTLEIIRHRSELTGIEITTSFAANLRPIVCDGARLQQALLNIVWNAIEAMPDGGLLSVAASYDKGEGLLVVDISDTGVGISKEDLQRIFEPFHTTKNETSGVGLGLSVAYGIIQQHGGRISVDSQLGKGTHFRIQLPRQPAGNLHNEGE
ncbi:MAG: PAS domain S-box protein [Deltaproteobacteria bacterium]|nr:PAS domain S-box protein [Deltaproteobacteria bacterium]MBW2071675.1 PAS domain S-box protein [Deltaproteobacteria bacterium]